jgi:hypothetical protein
MKKNYLLLLAFIFCFTLIAFSENNDDKKCTIILSNTTSGRDEGVKPEATYNYDTGQLSVTFQSDFAYIMQVKDASGTVLYQFDVISDGNAHYYSTQLSEGTYYVTITSPAAAEYGGELDANGFN